MDPKATLELARQAWDRHDVPGCAQHLWCYANWKMNGGFTDPQDDAEVARLADRIARIEMEREARFVAALDDEEEGEV